MGYWHEPIHNLFEVTIPSRDERVFAIIQISEVKDQKVYRVYLRQWIYENRPLHWTAAPDGWVEL